jgi:hypothetical protein
VKSAGGEDDGDARRRRGARCAWVLCPAGAGEEFAAARVAAIRLP